MDDSLRRRFLLFTWIRTLIPQHELPQVLGHLRPDARRVQFDPVRCRVKDSGHKTTEFVVSPAGDELERGVAGR